MTERITDIIDNTTYTHQDTKIQVSRVTLRVQQNTAKVNRFTRIALRSNRADRFSELTLGWGYTGRDVRYPERMPLIVTCAKYQHK